MSSEFFHRQGVFKRVRSVIIRPSQTPPTFTPRGILTRSLSARGERKRAVLRRQNAIDDENDDQELDETARQKSRMEKYFAEKPDKNIFMKLIHPSYHERNLQFKKIFVDKGLIEENDQFLASYSCAYQREILAQGRMFISQFNVCFYANIIGWETTLVIPMKEIKLIKKTKAAFIFPNSIQIERPTIKNDSEAVEKYFFASFINRDKSFQVLTTAHQKVIGGEEGKAMTREEVWDMVYNSEDKNHTPPDGGTPASGKNTSVENMTNLTSPSFNGSISPRAVTSAMTTDKDNTSQSSTSSDFQDEDSGAHFFDNDDEVIEEVPCPCTEHYGRLIMDKEFQVSVEKFYEMVFTDNPFLHEYNEKTKTGEYIAATWVRDHRGENTRTCTYTVSLQHAMAPKAIIVNEKQVLSHYPNPKQGLMMVKETQNSGVPYADDFTVNCRYCISRTGPTSCRVKVHGGIVYKKSVFTLVKTFIEKGTHQGLDEHYKLLQKMVDEYVAKHPDEEDRRTQASVSFPTAKSPSKSSVTTATSTNSLRQRRHEKRLVAAGERKTIDDDNFVAEMRPRSSTDVSALRRPSSTASAPSEYRPFLIVIIVLLAFFFIANLYILNGFKRETSTAVEVSKNEKDLGEMLSALMDQVKELKQKVDQLQQKSP